MPFKFTPGCCACNGGPPGGTNCGSCTVAESFTASISLRGTIASPADPFNPVVDTGPQPFSLTLAKFQRAEGEWAWGFGPVAANCLLSLTQYWAAIPEFDIVVDPILGPSPVRAKGFLALVVPGWTGSHPTTVAPPLNRRCEWGFTYVYFTASSFGLPPGSAIPDPTPPSLTGYVGRTVSAVSYGTFVPVPGLCRDTTPFAAGFAYSGGAVQRITNAIDATITAVR